MRIPYVTNEFTHEAIGWMIDYPSYVANILMDRERIHVGVYLEIRRLIAYGF